MYQLCRMEIQGTIKSKHVDQIRVITFDKNQEIDIFYTEMKKFDVEELVENERVVLDVRIQSIDYYDQLAVIQQFTDRADRKPE